MPARFEIAEEYMTSVSTRTVVYDLENEENPTENDLLKIMQGTHIKYTVSGSDDHPEFTKFRNSMSEDGFIKIERGWWNGDMVLVPFYLNGKYFQVGDQFPSAPAMAGYLKFIK
jgi:hypothetical protein